jgi:hypothetical protein
VNPAPLRPESVQRRLAEMVSETVTAYRAYVQQASRWLQERIRP